MFHLGLIEKGVAALWLFRIAKSLSTCSATTGDIVTATERLKLELETTTQRQDLIANFLHNYQLSPEEVCNVCHKSNKL